tara:strand:- start:2299 stop:2529 length:231 start_codon:yes stop_codon:yes gene_type:complete
LNVIIIALGVFNLSINLKQFFLLFQIIFYFSLKTIFSKYNAFNFEFNKKMLLLFAQSTIYNNSKYYDYESISGKRD